MSDNPTTAEPSPPPASAATPFRGRGALRHLRLWVGLSWSLAALGLVATLILGPLWMLGTAQGSAWLLRQLSHIGVEVLEPDGDLLGDFAAKKVTVAWSPTDRVEIDQPRWTDLSVSFSLAPGSWARLHARTLVAERVRVIVVPKAPDGKAPQLPRQVRLPLEIEVDDVRVAEVYVPGMAQHPFRDVQVATHLNAPRAPHHRFERASARLEPLIIRGHGRIGAVQPMALDVQLQAQQSDSAAQDPAADWLPPWARDRRQDWRAQLQAQGPLARFRTQASVRAQGQHLDASAWVEPVSPWPLPELLASTEGLDLSALFADLPVTALAGQLRIDPVAPASSPTAPSKTPAASKSPTTRPQSWALRTDLSNARPGAWSEQRLPLSNLNAELRLDAQPHPRWQILSMTAHLADARQGQGSLQLRGQGQEGQLALHAELKSARLAALDARLPAMTLSGPVNFALNTPPVLTVAQSVPTEKAQRAGKSKTTPPRAPLPAPSTSPVPALAQALPHITLNAQLSGQMSAADRAVQLRLQASGDAHRFEVQELYAQTGGAQASLRGQAQREGTSPGGAWHLQGQAALTNFDPRVWLPSGPRAGWGSGNYQLTLRSDIDLRLPDSGEPANPSAPITRLARASGQAQVNLSPSALGGVPIQGALQLRRNAALDPLLLNAHLSAGDNRIELDGQFASDAQGRGDRWVIQTQAESLAQLTPLLRLVPGAQASGLLEGLSGTVRGDWRLTGRWPELSTQGQLDVPKLEAGPLHMSLGALRWQISAQAQAPLDVLVDIGTLGYGERHLAQTRVQLRGSAASHDFSARSEVRAAPPAWVERLEGRPATRRGGVAPRTLVNASAHGSLSGGLLAGNAGPHQALRWSGLLQLLELRTEHAGASPWISTRNVGFDITGGDRPGLVMNAGRAELLTAGLRWNRLEWQAEQDAQRPQHLDLQAELEPLAVAPLLQRLQPEFGWGGDLRLGGKVKIQQGQRFNADVILERVSGDLQVTDDRGSQALGLSDLVLALNADNGQWSFTQGLAGKYLGVAAGSFVVRTSPDKAWPEPEAPLQGVVQAQVENLGTWGAWVPTGWRLGGQLRASASVGGRFGAPEYTGQIQGQNIAVRNLLEGIELSQGAVDISLQGDSARIHELSVKGGSGHAQIKGSLQLGASPRASMQLSAEKFQLLNRVDRRLVMSGQAEVGLDRDSLVVDGRFDADEGLFDLTRLGAPSLGGDVQVLGRTPIDTAATPSAPNTPGRNTRIQLQLGLGEHLTLRGKGLTTGLRGAVKIATEGEKSRWTGSVSTVDGHYTAYGQKLAIDRGVITFTGPVNDPRLDIEATRPNLDVRVGVAVTGSLLNPRMRLFSEPEMSDIDKLAWLMLGRASDGLGRSDTALLQRGALALLAGDDPSVSDQVIKTIGLDEVSVRQTEGSTTDSRDTIVSVGKQLTRRWYVGYERGLNATTGSWQLIYRLAQRFTLRAQSGTDQSLDMIWSWRWQ